MQDDDGVRNAERLFRFSGHETLNLNRIGNIIFKTRTSLGTISRSSRSPYQSGGNVDFDVKPDTVTTCLYQVVRRQQSIGCAFNYAG